MFKIRIANLVIGIENKYEYVRRLCREYETEAEPADFCVSVTEQEIAAEQENAREQSAGAKDGGAWHCTPQYCESACLYRSICLKLIEYDAFLMHAAAVELDGEGYLFAAKSGVGKTTHAKLWLREFGGRARVINGDKPVCRFLDGKLYACGTPWCGKEGLGANVMVPVKAICFLERAADNRIRRMEESEIIGRIFHQLLMPREEGAIERFLDMIDRMLASVGWFALQCNTEEAAARTAYEGMNRTGGIYSQRGSEDGVYPRGDGKQA